MSVAVAANPCRNTTARAINATTATPPQQRCQSNMIAVLGEQQAHGGAKGPPVPQCQGHLLTCGLSTQPQQLLLSNSGDQMQSQHQGNNEHAGGQGAARAATPRPSVGTQAIDTASATPPQQQLQTNIIAGPGEQQARGGGKVPPALQRRGHLLLCGPSTQPLPLLLSNSHN